MEQLTLVIPVYNEGKTILQNMETLREVLQKDGFSPEIILVDDGSRDDTWMKIRALSEQTAGVSAVRLSRNFGKEAAVFAGLSQVETERCVVMDSDLQHPPRMIRPMVEVMERTHADIVECVKASRGKESVLYKLTAKLFYGVLKWISGLSMDDSSDFKLINRKVLDVLLRYTESSLFFRGLVDWSGFSRQQIPFAVDPRQGDKSRFGMRRLMKMAIDSMMAYTSKPLYLTLVVGVLFFIGAAVLGVQTLYNYFAGKAVSGFTTVILLNLFTGALILFCMGVSGAYIARIYNEVKDRPQYIISEKTANKGSKGEKR